MHYTSALFSQWEGWLSQQAVLTKLLPTLKSENGKNAKEVEIGHMCSKKKKTMTREAGGQRT